MFWGEYSKGIPFLPIYKKEKEDLIIGIPRADGFIRLSFMAMKAMLSGSSYKIGSGLLMLSKEYRGFAIREKFGIHFGNNQLAQENLTVDS